MSWDGDADQTEEDELEETLQKRCAELEQQLRQDGLIFENEALEVQLVQMQDDYTSLQEDFRSMREYFGRRIADMSAQLEERSRAAGSAEGHADCLRELLGFHEDNGQLAGSYWRAQCEKRDDSIRFLTLKLQEYTVPSAEYRARRRHAPGLAADPTWSASEEPSSPSSYTSRSELSPTAALKAGERAFSDLTLRYEEQCEELQAEENEVLALQQKLQDSKLCCAELRAVSDCWRSAGSSLPWSEAMREELKAAGEEVPSLEKELQSRQRTELRRELPSWVKRCAWREELDIRAGQLEHASRECDIMKRSLDAANEELQWQATSAEALRMRLADIRLATSAEARENEKIRVEEERRRTNLEALLQRLSALRTDSPPAVQQAMELLETLQADREETLQPEPDQSEDGSSEFF
mmetsp:Transcript_91675/g.163167  ORF Transcript_91675/g.163167 Transcript_91675/m.163167 type:complete len:411 (-) Transcript_91675:30-1262(-)